jgi:SulP family sulfate permease
MSNLVHGALLWGMMTIGATYISHVPLAALAGVTAWMGFRLLDWGTWKRLPKMRLVDATAFLATAAGVLIADAVIAITIGCALYLVRYLLLRFVGAPAWLERQEQAASSHEQAAAATQSQSRESLTTTSASK